MRRRAFDRRARSRATGDTSQRVPRVALDIQGTAKAVPYESTHTNQRTASSACSSSRSAALSSTMISTALLTSAGSVPGEANLLFYQGRGVGIVISPWNFPLAIMAGMAVASIVAGNCVLIKPAEPSMVIAAAFNEILRSVKLPPGVANFVPGKGVFATEDGKVKPGEPRKPQG